LVIAQGDIWWADLGDPIGSEPGYRRPVLVVQDDSFNRSRIGTVVCVVLTSQTKWAEAPGNVLLSGRSTGLDRESVANVSQMVTLDRESLIERTGQTTDRELARIIDGVCLVLGRIEIANS
jgi:mRNA interferase MazF